MPNNEPPQNYYQILGVSPEAGQFKIKRAYRRLASQWHPDRVPAEKKEATEKVFRKIHEAYFVLGNREARNMYDHQRAVEKSVIESENWNFIELSQSAFNPDTFSYYYRAQLLDCDALRFDWREFLGGTVAKMWAPIWFFVFFIVGQNVLPLLSIDVNGVKWSVPAIFAALYIILGPVRDFVWEHIAEDETYDISVLGVCWLILIGFTVLGFSKPGLTPRTGPTVPFETAAPIIEKPSTSYDKIPVNLEIFKAPTDPSGKMPTKGKGEI